MNERPGPQLKGHPLKLVMTLQEKIVAEEYTNNDCGGINRRAIEAAEKERIDAYQDLARYILRLQKKLKKQREPVPRKGQPSLAPVTRRLMRGLSDEERSEIMRGFCSGCGSTDVFCHCQNDE